MFLYLCFLLAGFSGTAKGQMSKTVLLGTTAFLPCPPPPPPPQGDVTWSRYTFNGKKETLVTIINGEETRIDKRYSSLPDGSLVIPNVKISDANIYFCNGRAIYLEVTTDPNKVPSSARPEDGNVAVTPVNDRPGSGHGPDQEEDDQQSSDIWKVALHYTAVGTALVIFVMVTLIFYLIKKTERTKNKAATEVIYEN